MGQGEVGGVGEGSEFSGFEIPNEDVELRVDFPNITHGIVWRRHTVRTRSMCACKDNAFIIRHEVSASCTTCSGAHKFAATSQEVQGIDLVTVSARNGCLVADAVAEPAEITLSVFTIGC